MLTSLDSDIFKSLEALTGLSLYNNELKTLPDVIFKDLISIRIIHLQQNEFKNINRSYFNGLPDDADVLFK